MMILIKKRLIFPITLSLLGSLFFFPTPLVVNADELDNHTAVVLGSGGNRGSYEIGVWKALRELNIHYDIVTGSSIGSINAALMATDDFDTALNMWENINEDDVFTDPPSEEEKKLLESLPSSSLQDIFIILSGCVNGPRDVTPFKEFINTNIDTDKLLASNVTWGTYVIDYYNHKVKDITQTNVDSDDLNSYILASASPYPVFPLVEIDGVSYMDGGYYDELPIDLASQLGAENIIAVDITPSTIKPNKVDTDNITYIYPDWDLGNFLDFDHQQVIKNIAYGYNDTMQKYGIYDGFKYTFNKGYTDRSAEGKALKESMNPILNATIYDSTNGSLNMNQYYLRCAEVSAETFNIDPSAVYDIDNLNKLILNNYQNNSIVQSILKNIQMGVPLTTSFASKYPMETISAIYINFLQKS